jgi:hypothetical protein
MCKLPCPCVQVSQSASGPCPAIIVPHGGPHTALAVNYYMPFSFLTALGYCVVAVNYRGSLGFGEAGVQSLPGHAGHHDVEDCVASLDAAVAAGEGARTCVGGGRVHRLLHTCICVHLCGGSHRGCLSAQRDDPVLAALQVSCTALIVVLPCRAVLCCCCPGLAWPELTWPGLTCPDLTQASQTAPVRLCAADPMVAS